MPAHWLQVESCRAGFKSQGKAQLNALFSVVTMNADTDSASEEKKRQSNSRTRRPWYTIRTFDVSNNGQPP